LGNFILPQFYDAQGTTKPIYGPKFRSFIKVSLYKCRSKHTKNFTLFRSVSKYIHKAKMAALEVRIVIQVESPCQLSNFSGATSLRVYYSSAPRRWHHSL